MSKTWGAWPQHAPSPRTELAVTDTVACVRAHARRHESTWLELTKLRRISPLSVTDRGEILPRITGRTKRTTQHPLADLCYATATHPPSQSPPGAGRSRGRNAKCDVSRLARPHAKRTEHPRNRPGTVGSHGRNAKCGFTAIDKHEAKRTEPPRSHPGTVGSRWAKRDV